MLDTLRSSAQGLAAKILLSLLVLSFAVWGIGDTFSGFGQNTVATVGGISLTPDEYQRMFGRELNALSTQFKQRLTPEQGRKLGVDKRVFQQLLVDAHTRELGLGLGDEAIGERIKSTKAFQGISGKFDPEAFKDVLRQNGLSEAGYVALERQQALRDQIVGVIAAAPPQPTVLVDALNRYANESRTLSYFSLPAEKLAKIAPPDAAQLKTYFEGHSQEFRAPEYRRLALLHADPAELKSTVFVTDEEVKATFEANAARYETPEKRAVQQISFPDKAAADKALAEIKAGKDFVEVAKAAGQSLTDIDRGLVAKVALLDPKVGEVAFKLAAGTASEVIEGAFGHSIVRATEIIPGVKMTLADVKTEITDTLLLKKAGERLQREIFDKVEEERGKGTPIKDIAAAVGLKVIDVPAIDKLGLAPDGKEFTTLVEPSQVLKVAFENDAGVETDAIDLGKGAYLWVDVVEVRPERERTLDEAKAAVEAAYMKSETQKALSVTARELADRLNKGEDMGAIALSLSATINRLGPVTRNTRKDDLPSSLLPLSFALPKGQAASVTADDGKSRLVFRVEKITAPKPLDETGRKALQAQLSSQDANDLAAQYVASLSRTFGLEINQSVMDRLTGAVQP